MGVQEYPQVTSQNKPGRIKQAGFVSLIFLAGFIAALSLEPQRYTSFRRPKFTRCHVPLPNLVANLEKPPQSLALGSAGTFVDGYLSNRVLAPDMDSIAVSVVTPAGVIFEKGYGTLKANETNGPSQGVVDRDSIYRIASITKMFTVLETLILREKGALNWDDPVDKFLPHFKHPSHGWARHIQRGNVTYSKTPITLRQLASHMSGLGRDLPYQNFDNWPAEVPKDPGNSTFEVNTEMLLKVISKSPLVASPYTYPVYSNTGFSILGLSNVAANKCAQSKDKAPKTHRELIEQDIFKPLGLNSSFYRVPYGTDLVEHLAVPAEDSAWADMPFGDPHDAAGGQYSSLADLSSLMRTLLSPTGQGGVVSSYVVREWLRPLHAWGDGVQEVGAVWEIEKLFGSDVRLYTKGGNLPGYHSVFALNPQYGYGVVILVTGKYSNVGHLLRTIVGAYQPAFEALQQELVAAAYAGTWTDGNNSLARIKLVRGELYIEKLVVDGTDVFERLFSTESFKPYKHQRLPLWATGRDGEFRIGLGRPSMNQDPRAGCEPYWVSIDAPLSSRGYPIDLLYFEDGLVYPSAGARLFRTSD